MTSERLQSGSGRDGLIARVNRRTLTSPAMLMIIVSNLLPIYGLLYWDWNLFFLMMLYWCETAIIAVFANLHAVVLLGWRAVADVPLSLFVTGAFMVAHLFAIVILFGGGMRLAPGGTATEVIINTIIARWLWIPLLAMVVSHGYAFVYDRLLPLLRERAAGAERSVPADRGAALSATNRPFGRIVLMQLTVIMAGFFVLETGSSFPAYVMLVTVKTLIDIVLLLWRRAVARLPEAAGQA